MTILRWRKDVPRKGAIYISPGGNGSPSPVFPCIPLLSCRHSINEYTGRDSPINVCPRLKPFGIVDIMRKELQLPRLYSYQSVGQLPVVVYGCETWSLTLCEKRRQSVLANRVLRRMFGPNWDEVKGEWRKLHNEELNDPYSSPNIVRVIKSRRMRWTGHVARRGRAEVYTGFGCGYMRERDHFEDPGADERY